MAGVGSGSTGPTWAVLEVWVWERAQTLIEGILDEGDEPTEMDVFNIRTRLYQVELDPAAAEELARLRT